MRVIPSRRRRGSCHSAVRISFFRFELLRVVGLSEVLAFPPAREDVTRWFRAAFVATGRGGALGLDVIASLRHESVLQLHLGRRHSRLCRLRMSSREMSRARGHLGVLRKRKNIFWPPGSPSLADVFASFFVFGRPFFLLIRTGKERVTLAISYTRLFPLCCLLWASYFVHSARVSSPICPPTCTDQCNWSSGVTCWPKVANVFGVPVRPQAPSARQTLIESDTWSRDQEGVIFGEAGRRGTPALVGGPGTDGRLGHRPNKITFFDMP